MNNFQTTSQLIGKFTDRELTHEEESSLLYQASRNPLLRNELRLDRDINELFSDHKRIKLSETIRKTIDNERGKTIAPLGLTIAAFLIILFTVGGLIGLVINLDNQRIGHTMLTFKPGMQPKIQGMLGFFPFNKHLKTSSTPRMRREIAQNNNVIDPYTPSPEYEFLVGSVTRDLTLFVISPMPRSVCKADSLLTFSWRWITNPEPVSLEITDNCGNVVLRNLQVTDMTYILNTQHWNRGLYYYKIATGDELLTIGSISIY